MDAQKSEICRNVLCSIAGESIGALKSDYCGQPDELQLLAYNYSFKQTTNLSFITKILNNITNFPLILIEISLSCLYFLYTIFKI